MTRKKPITIKFGKLGKHKADGLAYVEKRKIVIDMRLSGVELLETILHEIAHVQQPDLSEEAVLEYSKETAEILWKIGYHLTDSRVLPRNKQNENRTER
jgi:hypothetical protein